MSLLLSILLSIVEVCIETVVLVASPRINPNYLRIVSINHGTKREISNSIEEMNSFGQIRDRKKINKRLS